MKLKSGPRHYRQVARARSAEATGRRITEAFLARLMHQWFDEITLEHVAADAKVTVQTVLRRFTDKEGLLTHAVGVLGQQIEARRAAPAGDRERLVSHLIKDYEQTGDAVIRLLALEPRHPALTRVLDFGRGEHRKWTAGAFVEPLGQLDPGTRQDALDALVMVTDVYTWKLLRRDMARSVAATSRIMNRLINATLSAFRNSNPIIQTRQKTSFKS